MGMVITSECGYGGYHKAKDQETIKHSGQWISATRKTTTRSTLSGGFIIQSAIISAGESACDKVTKKYITPTYVTQERQFEMPYGLGRMAIHEEFKNPLLEVVTPTLEGHEGNHMVLTIRRG